MMGDMAVHICERLSRLRAVCVRVGHEASKIALI